MVNNLILIAIPDVFLILICSFLGMFYFLVGYYNLTSDGRKIGILKMTIGGFGFVLAITFQIIAFEMPYRLIWLAAVLTPALLELSLIFQTNEKSRLLTLIVAFTLAFLVMFALPIIHYEMAENALRDEPDNYVRVEVANPVKFSLKDLGDGKYLIARDGRLEYETISSDCNSTELVLSQDEKIEVLPLNSGEEPHLAVIVTNRYERCPGIKILGTSCTSERTVIIHVLPEQTIVAYSGQ